MPELHCACFGLRQFEQVGRLVPDHGVALACFVRRDRAAVDGKPFQSARPGATAVGLATEEQIALAGPDAEIAGYFRGPPRVAAVEEARNAAGVARADDLRRRRGIS